jgi:hypothetical protein
MKVVAAPPGRQRVLDRGDHLGFVELLAGEGDDPLALLDEPDQRCLPVVPRDLDDVVHVVAVQPRGVGHVDEVALPVLQPLHRQQLPAFGGAVAAGGMELQQVGGDRDHPGVALVAQGDGSAQLGGVVAEVPDRWPLREQGVELRQISADRPALPAADRGQPRPCQPRPQHTATAAGRPLQPPGAFGIGS